MEQLRKNKDLPEESLRALIETPIYDAELFRAADAVRRERYGTDVYIRGLIELTNYCKNNCYYCGIRKDNAAAVRYRLSKNDILECCENGYALGFRTFVLQGGEDAYYSDALICEIVGAIRERYTDCAITLSLGEKTYGAYKAYFDAGANRYLLRHETADEAHYQKLHPRAMSLENRKSCLWNLKEIGYQVGSGFMVGSPYQTTECLMEDFKFLRGLQPDMVGVGPYITHSGTPFANFKSGGLSSCLRIVAILRLMFPHALIPATTALATICPGGREMGLAAGANVVMPNLSPVKFRKMYEIYENKLSTGAESAESLDVLRGSISAAGYNIVTCAGDVKREGGQQ